MLSQKKSPRLPLHTCADLFKKLKFDLEEFENDRSEYKAFNFSVTAYHLYEDWISAAGTNNQKNKRKKLPDKAKLLFMVWRDLTNATKHWKLDSKAQQKQVVDSVSEHQIGDWYSYLIAGPVIYVYVAGSRPSFPELACVTVDCFEWLLDDNASIFPSDLDTRLSTIFRPL